MVQIAFYFCDKSLYDTILVLESSCKSFNITGNLVFEKKDFYFFYDYPGLDIKDDSQMEIRRN